MIDHRAQLTVGGASLGLVVLAGERRPSKPAQPPSTVPALTSLSDRPWWPDKHFLPQVGFLQAPTAARPPERCLYPMLTTLGRGDVLSLEAGTVFAEAQLGFCRPLSRSQLRSLA